MASYHSRKLDQFTILLVVVLVGSLPEWASGQNCNCAPNFCCSRWGFCGTGDAYCGNGCQGGPCYTSVADIITPEFFDRNVNPGVNCDGRGFYTREALLEAASSFSRFGTVGSSDDARREVAALFAHMTHETTRFCSVNENNAATRNYCDSNTNTNTQFPCASGNRYFGRGPMQIKWNYNYGVAGNIIGFDGLNNPEILATDNVVSFKAALWFWLTYCHNAIVLGQDFEATIQPIEAMARYHPSAASTRIRFYRDYCNQLNVDPGRLPSTTISLEEAIYNATNIIVEGTSTSM